MIYYVALLELYMHFMQFVHIYKGVISISSF